VSGLSANPAIDEDLRFAALGVVEQVMNLLQGEGAQQFVDAIARDGGAQTEITMGAKRGSVLRRLGLPTRFTFGLVFEEYEGEGKLAAFASRKRAKPGSGKLKEMIILHVLPQGAQILAIADPQALYNHVMRALTGNPDVILHEATHMLDHFRGKRFYPRLRKAEEADREYKEIERRRRRGEIVADPEPEPQSLIDYISNPQEFNAFFQQGMFQLRQHLVDIPPGEAKRVMRNFNTFKDEADSMWALKQLREGALPKWEKKMDSRMYQTWEYWKKAMEDE
jgi:hypothetical protein